MKKNQNRSLFQRFQVIVAALLLMAAMGLASGEGSAAVINIGSGGISVEAEVTDVTSIELRVAGPGGFRDALQSSTGAVEWYPSSTLPDGEYRFEVFVTAGDEPEEAESSAEAVDDNSMLYYENGRFKVEGGVLSPSEITVPPPGKQSSVPSISWLSRVAQVVGDFLVPSVQAADLTITDGSPELFFDDTTTTQSPDWDITAWANPDYFAIYHYAPFTRPFCIFGGAGSDTFFADSNGDIELANGAVFIDKSLKSLGIGTITPTEDLHIVSGLPTVLLDETAGGDIKIENAGGELWIKRLNATNYNGIILTLENNLGGSLSLYPGVGIWEDNPRVPLHVESHDGKSAGLLVKNPTAPTAAGDVEMFALENTGNKIVRFKIQAGGSGSRWTFDNEPTYNAGSGIRSGRFRIAKVGTGVAEFSVDGYGHGRFHGNSYAMNHVNTCARDAKTDFQSLNERDILAKVMQLPLSQWRYKQEAQDARHIGPVAEDFQEVFGLGDGKHISTVDADGVALAAIKAIKAEKDAEIVALKEENRALAERLKALEELVLGRQKVALIMQ